MTKIVINTCFGGFGLSKEAMLAYATRKGLTLYPEEERLHTTYWTVPPEARTPPVQAQQWARMTQEKKAACNDAYSAQRLSEYDIARDDPDLVAVVEALGKQASGTYADLAVVEVPDDVVWEIKEYDGDEHVAEVHRTWR